MIRKMRMGFAVLILLVGLQGVAAAKTLQFSGYTWEVRSGGGDPGPCVWNESNAWIDENGYLHLKLTKVGGVWNCAQVQMPQSLGFGTYQFWVIGEIHKLDPNVVLGLFSYAGPPGTNEIDIELARWGSSGNPNLNYVGWPAQADKDCLEDISTCARGESFEFSSNGTYTTHRYTWDSKSIRFKSLYGHQTYNRYLFAKWDFVPSNPLKWIPQDPMPVMMNLWTLNGGAPMDGQPVEIVIRSFTYNEVAPIRLITSDD